MWAVNFSGLYGASRWIADGNSVKKQLEAKGYVVDLQFANDDIPTQTQQIDEMLTNGADILTVDEGIVVEELVGHGGVFKTPRVAQTILSDALKTPIVVREGAGEGGAWGIAVLANYLRNEFRGTSLREYLKRVFVNNLETTVYPDGTNLEGYDMFLERYRHILPAQRILTRV